MRPEYVCVLMDTLDLAGEVLIRPDFVLTGGD